MEEIISSNFIHDIIDKDLAECPDLKIHTRFPPEPNGYLHIGSAKAIMINVETAQKYGGGPALVGRDPHGRCILRLRLL